AVARKIIDAFGERTTTDCTERNRYKRFEDGEAHVEDRHRSGGPSVLQDSEMLAASEEEPYPKVWRLASRFGCTYTTVANRLHALGCREVSMKWISNQLTDGPHSKELPEDLITGSEILNDALSIVLFG
ncbi:hypothetical protein COOONC_28323, partial [Cooperia oncophora]